MHHWMLTAVWRRIEGLSLHGKLSRRLSMSKLWLQRQANRKTDNGKDYHYNNNYYDNHEKSKGSEDVLNTDGDKFESCRFRVRRSLIKDTTVKTTTTSTTTTTKIVTTTTSTTTTTKTHFDPTDCDTKCYEEFYACIGACNGDSSCSTECSKVRV